LMIFVPLVVSYGQHLLRYQVDGIASREGELYFSDSLSREVFIQEFLYALQLEGHPTAFLSSKTFSGDTLDIRLEAGQPFKGLYLHKGNLDDRLALIAGYQESSFSVRPLNFMRLERLFDRILDEAQNT